MKAKIDWKKEYILLWQALVNCFNHGVDEYELCDILTEAAYEASQNGSTLDALKDLEFQYWKIKKAKQEAKKFLQYLKEYE